MAHPQEILVSLEERFALDDGQLAIMGIARNMAATEKEIADAERSITFNRNYVPTPPGPRPHPEDGGMDHQDWEIAAYEYAHADEETDEAIAYAKSKREKAEDTLDDLLHDKDQIKDGDEEVVSRYARVERERIEKEIERLRVQAAQDLYYEKRKAGAEILGADKLASTINVLVDGITDETLRSRKGPLGWAVRPDGSFVRNMGQGPFNLFTEEIQINKYEGKIHFEYLKLPATSTLTELGRNGRRTNKPAEYYYFVLSDEGNVSYQDYAYGPITQGPDSIGNDGNSYYPTSTRGIKTNSMDRTRRNSQVSPAAVIGADDIATLQGVLDQVGSDLVQIAKIPRQEAGAILKPNERDDMVKSLCEIHGFNHNTSLSEMAPTLISLLDQANGRFDAFQIILGHSLKGGDELWGYSKLAKVWQERDPLKSFIDLLELKASENNDHQT